MARKGGKRELFNLEYEEPKVTIKHSRLGSSYRGQRPDSPHPAVSQGTRKPGLVGGQRVIDRFRLVAKSMIKRLSR